SRGSAVLLRRREWLLAIADDYKKARKALRGGCLEEEREDHLRAIDCARKYMRRVVDGAVRAGLVLDPAEHGARFLLSGAVAGYVSKASGGVQVLLVAEAYADGRPRPRIRSLA